MTDAHSAPRARGLLTLSQTSQPRMRLFCFAYAGGGPQAFRSWHSLLPRRCELIGIEYPGHGLPPCGEPLKSAAELAEELGRAVAELGDLPFVFFGHSMGALIAYETAHVLHSYGLKPARLLVSGRAAPHLHRAEANPSLSDDAVSMRLRAMGGTPAQILASTEIMSLLMPAIRADFWICDTYVHRHSEPLDVALETFAGAEDPVVTPPEVEAWSQCTTQPTVSHCFHGGHFFLHTEEGTLLTYIRESLAHV